MVLKKKEKIEVIDETEDLPIPTKTKEEDVLWKVGQVATQTQPVVYNTKTNEQYELIESIAKIMNDLEEIKDFLQE